MDASELSYARNLVARIAAALEQGETPSALRDLALQYSMACERAKRRLSAPGPGEAIAAELSEFVEILSDPAIEGWREFCRLNGLLEAEELVLSRSATESPGTKEPGTNLPPPDLPPPDIPISADDSVPDLPAAKTEGSVQAGVPAEADQQAFDQEVEALISAQGKTRGFRPPAWLWVTALLAIVLGLLLGVALPRWVKHRHLMALEEELNGFLDSNWEDAKRLVEGHAEPEDWQTDELSASIAAFRLAEDYWQFGRGVNDLPDPERRFDEIGRGFDWHGEDRRILLGLRRTATRQLEGWLGFQAQLEDAWSRMEKSMQDISSSPAVSESPAFDLSEPSDSELRNSLSMFPISNEGSSPYATAMAAIDRLGEARALVSEFSSLRSNIEAADSEAKRKALKQQATDLAVRAGEMVDTAQGAEKQPIEAIATTLADLGLRLQESGEAPKEVAVVNSDQPLSGGGENSPSTTGNPAAANLFPPTYVVSWSDEHNYEIELDRDYRECRYSKTIVPLVELIPEPGSAREWVRIAGGKLRYQGLGGPPIFSHFQDGRTMFLTGAPDELSGQFDDSFLIGFAAEAGERPEYQVLVCRPGSPGEASAYLLELAARDYLETSFEKGVASVSLSQKLLDVLSGFIAADPSMMNASPVLRMEADDGAEWRSAAASNSGFRFSAVSLELTATGKSGGGEAELKKQLDSVVELDQMRQFYEAQFEKAGEVLFAGISLIVTEYIKDPNPRRPDVPLAVPKEQKSAAVIAGQPFGKRPPFVEYVTRVVGEVLNNDELFDLGEGSGSDLEVLKAFESRFGGWQNGEFEGVRQALMAVTDHANDRELNIEGDRLDIPVKTYADREFSTYIEKIGARQALINADQFFENWAKLFARENVDKVWPYFVNSSTRGFDEKIAAEVKRLSAQLAEMKRSEQESRSRSNAPVKSLGSWYLDLEIPLPNQPGNPDSQTGIIPLIRFSSADESSRFSGDRLNQPNTGRVGSRPQLVETAHGFV